MMKIMMAAFGSLMLLTGVATAKSAEELALEHVVELYIAKQICFLDVRDNHFFDSIDRVIEFGYSVDEMNKIVMHNAIALVKLVEGTGTPWDLVCHEIEIDVQPYLLGN